MKYAKLNNGILENAPQKLHKVIDIPQPTDKDFVEWGYKKVIEDEQPALTENQYLTQNVEEKENAIIVHWVVNDYPQEEVEELAGDDIE